MSEIRHLRNTHEITQLELAGALGMSRSAISRLEHGTPRPEALERALQAIEAILEFRHLWATSPSASMEDWLQARAPLLRLAASRKQRDPRERQALQEAGDPVALLETEGRVKGAGARATRKTR